jgi:Icc-related predicted phosphoesterase
MPSWLNKDYFRLFFATDVHGSEVTFGKFLSSASFYKADLLVLGGDITGKMIVPIFQAGENAYHADLLGSSFDVPKGTALDDLLRRIRLLGFYPYFASKDEWNEIEHDSLKYDELFRRLSLERLQAWAALAEKKLKDKGTQLYVTGGNDDSPYIADFLKRQNFMVDPEDRVVRVGGLFDMISLGYSNPTPWRTPRECTEDELAVKIENLVAQVPEPSRSIFNIHVPPYGSTIDAAPMVDGSVTPPRYVLKDGMPQMISAGSTAVRAAIEKHQPILGLHGHIHESRGAIKIGKTLCINPGSEYGEGILRGVIVNLSERGLKSYQLTSG